MNALRDEDGLHLEDFFDWGKPAMANEVSPAVEAEALQREIAAIARDYSEGGRLLGREELLKVLTRGEPGRLTLYALRRRLVQMERAGLLRVGRGKAGIRLTELGEHQLLD